LPQNTQTPRGGMKTASESHIVINIKA